MAEGHPDLTEAMAPLVWEKLPTTTDSLLLLIDRGTLAEATTHLLRRGHALETPVAVIQWGATLRREWVVGTLADVATRAESVGLLLPAVLVVGEVALASERLRWVDLRPLSDKRILITRAAEQAAGLSRLLEAEGAEVLTLSAISIEPASDAAALDRALTQIGRYQWVIFTSANGVRAFVERLHHLSLDWRAFKGVHLGAIGPATAEALRASGVQPDFMPDEYVAEAITAGIGAVAGQRILLPRADIAREALAVDLRKMGAEVDEIAAYRTVVRPLDEQTVMAALARRPDAITFTSSSTVRGFVAALPELDAAEALRGVAVACIGPITAQTAREAGLTPQIIAEVYTMPGLTRALVSYFTTLQAQTIQPM
ncbi:MAG TPA: uroporphyrinogen-III synthase [Ktedonobacterales bacterium]|nr:uroporphyrinogen-III synthase [Ktedonobacterales bacterium]